MEITIKMKTIVWKPLMIKKYIYKFLVLEISETIQQYVYYLYKVGILDILWSVKNSLKKLHEKY